MGVANIDIADIVLGGDPRARVEDRNQPYIEVERVHTNEYTTTNHQKTVHDIEETRSRDLGDGYSLHAGMGTVDFHYTDYRRHSISDGSIDGPHPINSPPVSLRTQIMWVELPEDMERQDINALGEDDVLIRENEEPCDVPSEHIGSPEERCTFAGGLHGAEYGMIKMAPLELRLDNSDMGDLSTPMYPETECPTWFIHNAVEGGVGFSHSIYENVTGVARKTHARVKTATAMNRLGARRVGAAPEVTR